MECLICFKCRKRISPQDIDSGAHTHNDIEPVPVEETPAWKTYLLKAAQPFAGIRSNRDDE
jgi:hypothetical protein